MWELRANLEEHSDFYEPSSPEPEAINNPGTILFSLESNRSGVDIFYFSDSKLSTSWDLSIPIQRVW